MTGGTDCESSIWRLPGRVILVEEVSPDVVTIARMWPVSGPSALAITRERLVVVDIGVGALRRQAGRA